MGMKPTNQAVFRGRAAHDKSPILTSHGTHNLRELQIYSDTEEIQCSFGREGKISGTTPGSVSLIRLVLLCGELADPQVHSSDR